MKARAPKLFVGVGNVLRRDDGVGVRAAEILAGMPLPPQVEVCEAGTAALDLASAIEGRERVVVVDAMDAGARPGAVFRLTPDGLVLSEVAPEIDVERDIQAKVGFSLRVAPDVRPMDGRLFQAQPMGLAAEWGDSDRA